MARLSDSVPFTSVGDGEGVAWVVGGVGDTLNEQAVGGGEASGVGEGGGAAADIAQAQSTSADAAMISDRNAENATYVGGHRGRLGASASD